MRHLTIIILLLSLISCSENNQKEKSNNLYMQKVKQKEQIEQNLNNSFNINSERLQKIDEE